MKQLRIFTGHHAGVRLNIEPATYVLGASPQSTVLITDWVGPPGTLRITQSGATWSPENGPVESLPNFEPRRSGPVVWCIGPADGAAWPADVDLLGRLIGSAAESIAPMSERMLAHPRGPWWAIGATIAVALVGMGSSVTGRGQEAALASSKTSFSELQDHEGARKRMEHVLSQHPLWRPSVTVSADGLAVRGLAATAEASAQIRQQLLELDIGEFHFNVVNAANLVNQIAEGVGQPGVQVAYMGDGQFQIDGILDDPNRARMVASQLASDFGDLVQRIEVVAGERGVIGDAPLRATLHVDDFEYVQTRDGSKHLVLREELRRSRSPVNNAETENGNGMQ